MKFGMCGTLNQADCLVLGLFDRDYRVPLSDNARQEIEGLRARLNKAGDSLIHYQAHEFEANTLILIHCGDEAQFNEHVFLKVMARVSAAIFKTKAKAVTLSLPHCSQRPDDWHLRQAILSIGHAHYQFSNYKKEQEPHCLNRVDFYGESLSETAIIQAKAIAAGITLSRDLSNTPANVCTPTYLAEKALDLAEQYSNLSTTIIEREQMQSMGMGALLAVAQGSEQAPKLIEMNYRGGQESTPPIVLVGKGITFDSGGINLKPGNGMEEMKFDMCGAASVFGVIEALANMQAPVNVIGLLASAENMPSGRAVKPGDIITSLSGQTIEIINTDAEGRLVLCDALTYAERHQPAWVIDIATLTGAMVVALGAHYTGLFTSDNELAQKLLDASHQSGDKTWRMPLDECYQEALDSPYADMVNATFNRAAGSITAACFLSRFTKNLRWAHLDIAGTATATGNSKGATGRPVHLLTQFILNQESLSHAD